MTVDIVATPVVVERLSSVERKAMPRKWRQSMRLGNRRFGNKNAPRLSWLKFVWAFELLLVIDYCEALNG
jgi:hypothetical protein